MISKLKIFDLKPTGLRVKVWTSFAVYLKVFKEPLILSLNIYKYIKLFYNVNNNSIQYGRCMIRFIKVNCFDRPGVFMII